MFFIADFSKPMENNDLLMETLLTFYTTEKLDKMLNIINGTTRISLRIIDWFATNYAKKNFTVYENNGKR